MELYHGTNVRFETPKILTSNRALDFGAGFYATTDKALSFLKHIKIIEL
ncbi:MAG: DUF3990 domain-containing protein [Candidatus Symbiothrix sp.]|jgi:hypothetical protein|nr:DUF3990 domain-containing protein [Candidatus Symbiothrix sp.]